MNPRTRNRRLNELPSYTGQFKTATNIKVIQYTLQSFSEKKTNDITEIQSGINTDCVTWIRVCGMTDSDKIIELTKKFGLSMLDAKRILTIQYIISVEEYDDNLLVIVPAVYNVNGKTKTEQVTLIMGKNYMVTIQESNYPFFEHIYSDIQNEKYLKFNNRKSDFILASMINEIITNYSDEIAQLENDLEDLEDLLLDVKQLQDLLISNIQEKRREMINLRKLLSPFKIELAKLLRVDTELISHQDNLYFKDIYEQLLYILQNLESCREILSSLIDLYLNNNDLKMNIVMKQLTVVSTIFIPLTFLVGVWGMNFKFMPELEFKYGYLIAWILMIFLGLFIWIYMKRKKWF
ncbi:MAG: magnesium/cobalt transporter CorA [Prevotellaceae bacterium]|jgi:magnesium transporter|nr:magnesium/cobalt transporter CorA [Prevotellaceae bacterium]